MVNGCWLLVDGAGGDDDSETFMAQEEIGGGIQNRSIIKNHLPADGFINGQGII
ncbi:MAG: hypothetical protein JW774_00535 [Candidatus Aureabacteria bacterium]|nr:hypothetical protein [Candidatus Auribacterota bacterium]